MGKRVAFDIDGVLTDLNSFLKIYGCQFFKDNEKKYNKIYEIVDQKSSSLCEMFDCNKEQEKDFWTKYLVFYSSKIESRLGASDFMKKLVENGNELFLLSARIKAYDNDIVGNIVKKLVYDWVKKENLPVPKENIQFCPLGTDAETTAKFKANWCKENNIDFVVEDTPDNIQLLREITNVICFKTPYNESYNWEDVIKVDFFHEIYDYIAKENKENFREFSRNERDQLNKNELENYYLKLRRNYIISGPKTDLINSERIYRLIYNFIKKIFDKKYEYEVKNKELLENIEPGTLFVINHRDMIDLPMIMSAIGNRPVHLLLKNELKNTKIGPFLQKLGCVFVDRENRDSQITSKEELIKILLHGGLIIMCPEGTRNKTSENLLNFQLGAVSIARTVGCPIKPVVINKKFDDFSEKIILTIGQDFFVNITDDLEEKNNEIRSIMENMYINENLCNKKSKTV